MGKYEYKIPRQIYAQVGRTMPEPFINQVLYGYLDCIDATPEGRTEARQLLALSETVLTTQQREKIQAGE